MLHRIIILCTFLFLAFLPFSCVDVIDFERPSSYDDAIAIHGRLIKGEPSFAEVKIQAAFDLTNYAPAIPMEEVLLLDEEDNRIALKVRRTGEYRVEIPNDHPTMKIEYRRRYKIQLRTKDGKEFESDFDQLLPGIQPDSLTARRITIDGQGRGEFEIVSRAAIGFNIYTPTKVIDSDETAKFLWEVIPTYKITDSPRAYSFCCGIKRNPVAKTCYAFFYPKNAKIVYNASNTSRGRLDNFQIYKRPPYHIFAEGYYLTVFQYVLSQEAFKYWEQLDLLTNPRGDVFQQPSGRTTTNITSKTNPDLEVYGFFYSAEQQLTRVYVPPELAGDPDRYCPAPAGFGCPDPVCCNCESIENSTSVKPEWWVE